MRDGIILWEAHRGGGGGYEMPESCKLSFEYGWLHGGRPEADVNLTSDNVMVSLHDPNLNRIAHNLPEQYKDKPISEISWAELQTIDIGWDQYPNQHVVSMEDLFIQLQKDPARNMVIDYKRVPLPMLADMINKYKVGRQITFACHNRALLREIKVLVPEIRTKNWLGGTPQQIIDKFHTIQAEGFEGITEVQLHLNGLNPDLPLGGWRYDLPQPFVADALTATKHCGILLQTLPWKFEREDIFAILDLGVRSFAVDYPHKFTMACAEYFGNRW